MKNKPFRLHAHESAPGARALPRLSQKLWMLLATLVLLGMGRTPLARASDALSMPSGREVVEDVQVPPKGWQTLSTRYTTIQFPPDERGAAREVADFADADLERLMDDLDLSSSKPIVVRLAGDFQTFTRVQPSRPPSWAAGTAYPAHGLMVLLTRNGLPMSNLGSFETTFIHESAHLLLGQAFGPREIPRWLNEGLARFAAHEMSIEEWATLSRAAILGRLIPLSELEKGFPEGSARAELAYAESRDFLSYLTTRGPDVLPRLIEQLSQGRTLNEALWATAGAGLTLLEEDWEARLTHNYAWVPALAGSVSLGSVGSLLLVLAWLRRRRITQERRARWAVEEAQLYGPDLAEAGAAPGGHLRLIQGGATPPVAAEEEGGDEEEEEEDHESEPREGPWFSSRSRRGDGDGEHAEGGEEGVEERPPPGGWLH